jgi:hypothetical protein
VGSIPASRTNREAFQLSPANFSSRTPDVWIGRVKKQL